MDVFCVSLVVVRISLRERAVAEMGECSVLYSVQFSSVQSLSRIRLFATS